MVKAAQKQSGTKARKSGKHAPGSRTRKAGYRGKSGWETTTDELVAARIAGVKARKDGEAAAELDATAEAAAVAAAVAAGSEAISCRISRLLISVC